MLRILGIGLISLSIASVGFLYSDRLTFRKRYLEQLVLFSKGLINEMQGRNDNVFSIFSNVSAKELLFLRSITKADISDLEEIKTKAKCNGIFAEDTDTVASFLFGLGTSDIEGQKSHCEYYSGCFDDKRREAEELILQKGKPARILSTLGGLALFIILI